jgi:hypothetical protein
MSERTDTVFPETLSAKHQYQETKERDGLSSWHMVHFVKLEKSNKASKKRGEIERN